MIIELSNLNLSITCDLILFTLSLQHSKVLRPLDKRLVLTTALALWREGGARHGGGGGWQHYPSVQIIQSVLELKGSSL